MSESSSSNPDASWFSRPVWLLTVLAVRWPRTVLAIGIAVALLSLGWMYWRLDFKTSRLDLLNPNSGYNQLWLQYLKEFGSEDDAVILVEGADRAQVEAAMNALATEIAKYPDSFHTVFHKADLSAARAHALYYLPADKLAELSGGLQKLQPILQGDWSALSVGNQLGYSALGAMSPDEQQRKAALDSFSLHMQNLHAVLSKNELYHSPWAEWDALGELQSRFSPHYSILKEGQMGIVLLRLADDGTKFDRGTAAIEKLRDMLMDFQRTHEGIQLGLTGLPVMENDEMKSNESATLKTTIVSLLGVAGLFIAGFGGIRHPLLAVAALMIGLAWSCGYLTLAVGHLNILSMAFGVTLIGQGIDFGIHYLARYLAIRNDNPDTTEALKKTASAIGPGIITGGVTTSIAFFAATLTDFTGVAELGVIAGGGIFLCILAALLMLPAMLQWMDGSTRNMTIPRPLAMAPTLWLSEHIPRTTMAVSLVVILICAIGLPKVWYDHNLLHLQAEGLESVRLEERLLAETDQSVWYAISVANSPAEILARKAKFDELETVERTEEIVSFLPTDVASKQALIEEIGQQLVRLPKQAPQLQVTPLPQFMGMLEHLHAQLVAAQQTVSAESIQRLSAVLHDLPAADAMERISTYQQELASDLLRRLHLLEAMSSPTPPTLETLPIAVRQRFVGQTGKHMLKIYSNADIWNMDELEKFVTDVRAIDSQATGQPLQTYEASRQMQNSYIHAALYALIGVTILLVIDFQSLGYALLALVPVGLGLLQLFGLLGLLDIPLNPANLIVLPLILGIGLDEGVHVLHEYRSQTGPFRMSRWTATAIVLTSLTTMVGFGSLMMAEHRGLQSLGRVLSLGVACCLFTSLVPLPACLTWLSRNRRPAELLDADGTAGASGRGEALLAAEDLWIARRSDEPHAGNSRSASAGVGKPADEQRAGQASEIRR